jgi:hypothetical protein
MVDNFYVSVVSGAVVSTLGVFTRGIPKIFAHISHTNCFTMYFPIMPKQPPYFDSQASAAATLKIEISELREAKAQGCPAFRSGRVYRDELLCWRKEHHSSISKSEAIDADEPEYLGVPLDWENRRPLLFLLHDFLDCLFADGVLSAADYVKLGDKTIPLIIKIGRVWVHHFEDHGR